MLPSPAESSTLSSLEIDITRVAAPVREQVLAQLRQAIVERRLKPGQRLVERELVKETGVSRGTIREVLRELAAEELVTTIPNRGTVVASPSIERAVEVYEVRAALEGMAVRQFVERASAEHLAALRAAFEGLEVATASNDIEAALASKRVLYDALFTGAGNDTIRSIVETLQARVTLLRASSLSRPGRNVFALQEVRAIVEAIEAGDADAAYDACVYHIHQAAHAGLSAMASHDPHSGDERNSSYA